MKHHKASIVLLISILLLLLTFLLSSCNGTPQETKFTEYSLDYFDTATTITGYAPDRETFDAICDDILAQLAEYHKLYTIYNRYEGMENLCTINELENGIHRTVTVDRRIVDMLLYAKEMYAKTNGKLNIAMGSVLSIWHDYRTAGLDDPSNAELPPMEDLSEAALHTNINDLIIDEDACTVWLADPRMTLDVGAIAKGYAVEMTARMLEERGISGFVINVGGNVRTVGTKANGELWLAGIENPVPDAEEPYVAYLGLAGESIVTSGSYQRFYIVDGKNYHHIIDAETLLPADRYLSVSIVCKDSALGDALSTALFCMTPEDGLALIESIPDAEALWIMTDESRQQSSGFASYLTEP